MFRIPFRSRVSDLDLKHFESDLASTGFQGSLIALFPGTNTSWLSLGLLEFVSAPGCRRPPDCRPVPTQSTEADLVQPPRRFHVRLRSDCVREEHAGPFLARRRAVGLLHWHRDRADPRVADAAVPLHVAVELDRALNDDRRRSAWAVCRSPERRSINRASVARHDRRGTSG